MAVVAYGPELIVNSITAGHQYRPFITALANGGFMIGWQDASGLGSPPGDISDDTRFATYDAFGIRQKPGVDTIANTQKLSAQQAGQAAAMTDGKFVVVWTDEGATAPLGSTFTEANGGVKLQIFNADGSKSGSEVLVNPNNSSSTLAQDQPSVSVLENGKIMVTWTSEIVGASGTTDIIGRLFNANGSPAGGQFTINTQLVGNQDNSTVHALSTGGFAVVWDDHESSAATGFQTKTFIRFYTAAGAAVGAPLEANAINSADPSQVSLTELSDGRIAISWTENQTVAPGDASGTSVKVRIYNPATLSFGPTINVNTTTSNDQNDAQIAALDHGQFVVVWTDASQAGADNSFAAVRMQVFSAAGAKVGAEILVNNQTTFDQKNPVVTVLDDFRFVVAWEDDNQTVGDLDGFSIHAQIFDARIAGITLDGNDDINNYVGSSFADTINGLGSADQIFGGGGADFLIGGGGKDFLSGDDGDDRLKGASGDDLLKGGLGNDVLDGQTGADRMLGAAGNDFYYVDNIGDQVVEKAGEGIDTVRTTLAALTLAANVENLEFIGTGSFNGTGNALANRITGGSSGDVLRGGAGNDTIFGKAGADIFVYSETTGYGVDRILDFQDNVDKVRFSTAVAANIGAITIAGNGTNHVTLTTADGVTHLFGAAAITITSADLQFV